MMFENIKAELEYDRMKRAKDYAQLADTLGTDPASVRIGWWIAFTAVCLIILSAA
jgi:aryl-alcohol dehydrogenase-like predicted oxidoreductase